MSDLIDRQAVNDLISKFIIEIHTEGGRDLNAHTNDVLRQILRNINSDEVLPSVNPQEPKTGHWTFTTHYARRYRICPFCNVEREDDRSTRWNFCPNCGADMRGDDNEVDS